MTQDSKEHSKSAPLKKKKAQTGYGTFDAPQDEKDGFADLNLPEPTRYGDWEVKGRCSDF